MKDMKFNIDIIFIDVDGKIVDMVDNFEACREEPCPIYESGAPAKYVLEVNSGFNTKYNLEIGDIVEINK